MLPLGSPDLQTCFSAETVMALFSGGLSESQTSRVDEHMDACPACRTLVAETALSAPLEADQGKVAEAGEPQEGVSESDPAGLSCAAAGHTYGGRFQIRRRVGAGAMGVVYEADDLELGIRVALKVLPRELVHDARLWERLRSELVLGRRISHHNICRLHDFGISENTPFITMEFLEGQTLAELLADGPPPQSAALDILKQVCRALGAAHERGVVHRDLKPSNIMVGPCGRVTVMDFGLARDLDGARSEGGCCIGTPAYWSPEQSRGQAASPRSDIYSFGMIACELLGGSRPGDAAEQAVRGVPSTYRELVTRCLASEPKQRHASGAKVLQRFIELPKRRQRLKGTALLAALSVLVLIAMAASASSNEKPPTAQSWAPDIGKLGAAARQKRQGLATATTHTSSAKAAARASERAPLQAVELRVHPPGATIMVGSTVVGVGSARLMLDRPVVAHISLPGYRPMMRTIAAAQGPLVEARLTPLSPRKTAGAKLGVPKELKPRAAPLPIFD